MKQFLLAFAILITSTTLFAANKISVGEKWVVVANQNAKKITVHDKLTLEIVHTISLESRSLRDMTLSNDESKIWYLVGGTMNCISTSSWETVLEIQGMNLFLFEFNALNKQMVHYEGSSELSHVAIYDLNSTEIIHKADLSFSGFIEAAYFDDSLKQIYLLSKRDKFNSELPLSEEDAVIFPESREDIEKVMKHDGKGSRLLVFDLNTNAATFDDTLYYSPNFSSDIDKIGDRLFLITQVGNCELLKDNSLRTTSFIATNVADYTIHGTSIFGANQFTFFQYNSANETFVEFWDDEVNIIILESTAIDMDKTHCFVLSDNILYRFDQTKMMNVETEISVE
jgi:hypothetical protein